MSAPDNEQLSDWTKEWLARIYGGPPRYYVGLKESWMRVPYWIYRMAQWVPMIDRKVVRLGPVNHEPDTTDHRQRIGA